MSDPKLNVDAKKLRFKPSAFAELLRTHYSVYVQLDGRKDGVIVPSHLRIPQLSFQLGLNMKPIPIHDLKIDNNGFSATLAFDKTAFKVFVPWNAVYAIVGDSGIGNVWHMDMPTGVTAPQRNGTFKDEKVPVQRDPEKHRLLPPGWRVIDGGGEKSKSKKK